MKGKKMKWKRHENRWGESYYLSEDERWEIDCSGWEIMPKSRWRLWAHSPFLTHRTCRNPAFYPLPAIAVLLDDELPTLEAAQQLVALIDEHQPDAWGGQP